MIDTYEVSTSTYDAHRLDWNATKRQRDDQILTGKMAANITSSSVIAEWVLIFFLVISESILEFFLFRSLSW